MNGKRWADVTYADPIPLGETVQFRVFWSRFDSKYTKATHRNLEVHAVLTTEAVRRYDNWIRWCCMYLPDAGTH